MKIEEMSVEELERYNNKLSEKREAIRQEQLVVNEIITRKTAEAEARRKLDQMSDAERAALRQALAVPGIESQEVVNEL